MQEVRLRDGSRIGIRPIEPDDRDALLRAFERLSPTSRYRRFFGPMPELRPRDLDYLTRVDHHGHEALVAVDEDGEGVGVARYVRIAPGVAEPAIAVVDDWQGRGVASALLRRLVARAREEGIERFDAPILASNRDAIHVFEHLGDTSISHQGREVLLRIELPAEREAAPLSLTRWPALLRQFAAGAVEPARTVVELLLPPRRGRPDAPRRNVIVVGTDGSSHAQAAVEAAGSLAALSDAAVEIVAAYRFAHPETGELADASRDAARLLRERGLHVHEHVRRGDAALVLVDVATEQDARLIVVGAGGRSGAARRLIGGVADLVAERAPCNVLIVRPRQPST